MIRRTALCAMLLAAPVAAGEELRVRGVMQATVFAALPAKAPMTVRPPDASQQSADIAAAFAEGLLRLGHAADPGALLQLSFRIADAPGVGIERPPNIELRGSLGAEGNDDAELVLRMQMLEQPAAPGPTRTRLMVVEVAGRGGKPFWEARVEASAAIGDDVALAEALVPHVLSHLGQAAWNLPIPEPSR